MNPPAMLIPRLIPLIPLIALLCWAAVEDLRVRRIRNWLSFSVALMGLAQSAVAGSGPTPLQSLAGLCVGFTLMLALFLLGAVGGGDVKLMAGIGAWVGAFAVFELFCAQAVVGMVIVLCQAIRQGRLKTLTRNSAVLAGMLIQVDQVGLEQMKLSGQSCRSVDRPLPFAVPVLIALVLMIVTHLL